MCHVENIIQSGAIGNTQHHGPSQDLETGCPKLPIVKFWGILFFKGDHNILKLQPQTYFYGIISCVMSCD